MRVWLGVALVLASVGCGGGSATTCTHNSDCPTGRYCMGGACRADCASDAECVATHGAGAICTSFGMCAAAPDSGMSVPDSGSPADAGHDAAVVPSDAGSDAPAPDTATVDAAVCVAEVCTPSAGAAPSIDEDCDGAIDEGCPWFFGRPHAVLPMAWAVPAGYSGCFGSYLDENGTDLYVACSGAAGGVLMHTHRATRADPFDQPTRVAFVDTSLAVYEVTLERGGLRGVLQAGSATRLYLIERPSLSMPFTATVIASIPIGSYHPTLSRDGIELFYSNGSSIYRAVRPTPSMDFGASTQVAGLAGQALSLSEDGHDLFFHAAPAGRPVTLFRARRADVSTATFDPAVEIAELNPTGTDDLGHPNISLATRELFFAAANRAWQPTSVRATYRVQICRDGPCSEPLVACPPSGRRSPDGFHCYRSPSSGVTPQSWMQNVLSCAADGSHPVTIHSDAERALVTSAFGTTWLGGTDAAAEMTWRWDWPGRVTPEEPFLYPPMTGLWASGEPNDFHGNEDCAADNGGAMLLMNDAVCASSIAPLCEDEVWPTW